MFVKFDTAQELLKKYGSPLYVYSESILRQRCRDLLEAFRGRIKPRFSAKANTNLSLLKIIHEEGLGADAMSPGEIFVLQKAGFAPEEIFYIGNNVSCEEMSYCLDRGILVSVDSLSQLEQFGQINPGGRVAVRFNPGMGAGHCEKVITAGHKTKFGVQSEFYPEVKKILEKYDLQLAGINQHIGSLFLEAEPYVKAAKSLLDMIAENFSGLEFIDFGGGFGVPYKPGEKRLDLDELSEKLFQAIDLFLDKYDNKDVHFKCEPGRYISAECGLLLGTVHAVKKNYGKYYVGTDIGFNVMMRHVLYESYHEIEVLSDKETVNDIREATIVGNICESGDILASDRNICPISEGDIIAVKNAGAYGYSMASNYNCRLRPAEVLIFEDGSVKLIRKADTMESLMANF
ncbi:MAG: diaminopimelate decarboxylase [Synergistaceae bacterium]|nr:diaminopimelate decarboxylase [Synergistaceae bacterium]